MRAHDRHGDLVQIEVLVRTFARRTVGLGSLLDRSFRGEGNGNACGNDGGLSGLKECDIDPIGKLRG